MRTPIFVRGLTDSEQNQLEAGLRSSDAFVLRRCQILLASARKERVPQIALTLGCDDQTVLNVIAAFQEEGLDCLKRKSSRPHNIHTKIAPGGQEQLRALVHQSPRQFGKPTSIWSLQLLAEVSFAQGITTEEVSDETIRVTLKRLGLNWNRAKHWITSPDPDYNRKKGPVTV